jgi:hypothetical protein
MKIRGGSREQPGVAEIDNFKGNGKTIGGKTNAIL